MTGFTTINNNRAMFIAAHAEARRLRENWPNVMYSELFRDALRHVWAAVIATRAAVAAGLIAATKKGIAGCVRAFRAIANRINNKNTEATMTETTETTETTADVVAEKLIAAGGRRWSKAGHDRVYFNGGAAARLIGYEFEYYKTGNLSTVKKNGEFCSNCHGRRVLGSLSDVFVDLNADNKIVWKFGGENDAKAEFEQKIAEILAA